MKGKILGVESFGGVITGEGGGRFKFEAAAWKGSVPPRIGMDVDFVATENKASEIYPAASSSAAPGSKSKVAAGVLAILLGGLGAHKFYLGYTVPAVIMLLIFFLGWLLLFIPNIIVGIIALIEGIIYLTKSDEDFQRTYVDNKRPWF